MTIPPLAMVILISLLISIIGLALSLPVFDFKDLTIFNSYFNNMEIVRLNFYPVLIVSILLYLVLNSTWLSVFILSTVFIGFGLLNKFKIQYIDSPLALEDLKYIKELLRDLIERGASISKELYILIGIMLFILIFLKMFFDFKIKNKKLRIGYILITLILGFSVYNFKYKAIELDLLNLTVKENKDYYIENGFVNSFIQDIERKKLLSSNKFDEENGKKIVDRFISNGLESDINIITILVEEYYDFTDYTDLKIDNKIYNNYKNIKNKSLNGNLIVNEGLLRTEEEYLTGYINNHNYSEKTNSHVWYFKNNNYRTEYMTNRNLLDYNRLNKNKYIGFDTSTSIKENNLAKEILEGYKKSKDMNKSYFNYTKVNLREDNKNSKNIYIEDGRLKNNENMYLNNYFKNINDLDKNLGELVEFLDKEEKPVMIVFMSNGSPKLGKNQEIYNKLGINIDLETEEGFMNKYSVPYFVWGNENIKNLYNKSFDKKAESLSPNFLLADIIDYLDLRGSQYMQFINNQKEKCSVINRRYFKSVDEFIDTKKLPNYLKEYYKDYGDVEYYIRENFGKDTI